jgi:predicted dehydrogenase
MNASCTRRTFLSTGLGMAALAAGEQHANALAAAAAVPSERVRIAFIGCGTRGQQLLKVFAAFHDVQIVALCDVNGERLGQAQALLGGKPDRLNDYRKVLDRKDVDAVVVASPLHWHGLHFIHACLAGKHVYVEKPLSHTIAEGRAMVRAAQKTGVVALTGTQQRGGPHYQEAIAAIQAGELGTISLVECFNDENRGIGLTKAPDELPPAGLDWDQWLGPAPMVPFNRARLQSKLWFAYNGGMMTDWGVHHFDTVRWAMKTQMPERISCLGGRYVVDDITDTPDTFTAAWEFPGFLMQYTYRCGSRFPTVYPRAAGYGIAFYGNRATLAIDRNGYDIWLDKNFKQPAKHVGRTECDGPWQRLFVDCVKQNRQPPLTLEESHRSTVCSHLGNIAYLTRRTIHWDPQREQIIGDEEATRMLSRPRRQGFELPEV